MREDLLYVAAGLLLLSSAATIGSESARVLEPTLREGDALSIVAPSPALINEVCWWQSCKLAAAVGSGPWIEIVNPSTLSSSVAGWSLVDRDGALLAALPSATLPPGAYLVVAFGTGESDLDFSDDRGLFFADTPFAHGWMPDGDPGAAMLVDEHGDLVDAVVWSDLGNTISGAMIDRAIDEGDWPEDDVFPFADHYTLFLSSVVPDGTSFGRTMTSEDTNAADDWTAHGGLDATEATPGAQNVDPDLVEGESSAASGPLVKRARKLPPDPGRRVWAVLFYVDGREKKLGSAWNKALKTIAGTEYSRDVAFVAQFTHEGRTRRYAFFDGFQFGKERYEIEIPATEGTNPGDPAALEDFIEWSKATYPAQKYAIVMVGHGQGWKGTNIVSADEDLLIMSELEQGLQALGRPFDTLIFESCLMGTVEVAYQLAGEVENLMASEEVMWMNVMPWGRFARYIRDDKKVSGADVASKATTLYSEAALKSKADDKYTVSHISPEKVKSVLFPAVQDFARALENDIETIKRRDEWEDNLQVKIFEKVLRPSEMFFDGSYRDLGHVAELAAMERELTASQPAAVVKQKLMRRSGVILQRHAGKYHPKATGLSIYFPQAQTQPDFERKKRPDSCAHLKKHCGEIPAFDHPRYCPHLYARDPDFRLPWLRTDGHHTMKEDAGFHFTVDGGWDEFLHRFYKPVADACIRTGSDCVKSIAVEVGQTVTLSGHGSSDIDCDAENDEDQENHQPLTWHWDFDISRDAAQMLPDYQDDMQYPCMVEDCDRNDADGLDDDADAHGEVVAYTCAAAGTYEIKLWTWDDHNGFPKLFDEDEDHNTGKHWLHFNIDDDPVTVSCIDPPTEPPTKRANKAQVQPGEDLSYEILLPPTSGAKGAVEPASIVDPLPPEAIFVEGSLQCPELGVCRYDAARHLIVWEGSIGVDETARVAFEVLIREDVPCVPGDPNQPPPEVINRADTERAGQQATAMAGTPLDCPVAAR